MTWRFRGLLSIARTRPSFLRRVSSPFRQGGVIDHTQHSRHTEIEFCSQFLQPRSNSAMRSHRPTTPAPASSNTRDNPRGNRPAILIMEWNFVWRDITYKSNIFFKKHYRNFIFFCCFGWLMPERIFKMRIAGNRPSPPSPCPETRITNPTSPPLPCLPPGTAASPSAKPQLRSCYPPDHINAELYPKCRFYQWIVSQ